MTTIGIYAFNGCYGLTSVNIPASVTSIEQCAFYNCRGLSSVTIPSSVTNIEFRAFYGCKGLTSITIPSSVTSIGDDAFQGCSSLSSLSVANGNTVYDSRESCNAIIETSTNTLIIGCTNTIIPLSVSSIGDYAFEGCESLTSINIPLSVTSIGRYAFNGCKGLTSITIPSSVTSIGDDAFSGCIGIKTVNALSAVPPTAYSNSFSDVYSSAFLYVPIGSEEAYGTAEGWNQFAKLREKDFGIKDCVLTVKGLYGGSMAMKCKTMSTYTFQITAEEGWKVSSVLFNGADVTANIRDGQYTTPSLMGDSELSIAFNQGGNADESIVVADLNKDGSVSITDVGILIDIILEKDVPAGVKERLQLHEQEQELQHEPQ